MSNRPKLKALADATKLSGPEKAAVILLALGEEHAQVWQQLDEEEIKEVSQAMASLGTVTAANPLMGFDKNDIMRAAEVAVMAIVAILMMLFIVRPLLRGAMGGGGGGPMAMLGGATRMITTPDGQQMQIAVDPVTGQSLLPGPGGADLDQKIDIARIEGQVKASSVKRVSEFVEKHPEESVSIIRTWLHESA